MVTMVASASSDQAATVNVEGELPGYSSHSPNLDLIEHIYQLEDRKSRSWVWLTVKSHSKDPKQLPLVYERDIVSGSVEVDFDRADGAKSIAISLTAGVTAVGQEEKIFLDLTNDLWSSKGSTTRPQGKMSWPFSIALPAETPGPEKKSKQMYPLPPSFSERASPAYIDYKLVVTIRRGTFKVNQILTTSLAYLPLSRPDPPSHLRQISYQEGGPLIGPEGDPDGWKVLPSIKTNGTIFNLRPVDLQCTLALSKPTVYAAGTPLPLQLILTSSDEQALDLLSSTTAIKVHLVRSRAIGSHATDEDAVGRSNNTFKEGIASAFFWPSDEGGKEAGKRVLQGEIDVKRGLKPSFVFPGFGLRYSLVMLPFKAPGYLPSTAADEPLLAEKLTITTVNAIGIVPRSYAPPGYVHPEGNDFNNAMGYLENGNQRFYHHHGFT